MTVAEWLVAEGARFVPARGCTVAEALAAGDDEAIALALSTPDPNLHVSRGVVSPSAFAAAWTAAMDAALTPAERTVLREIWLAAADGVDVDGPAITPVLDRVGYPRTRAGTMAERLVGRARVTAADVAEWAQAADWPVPRVRAVRERYTVTPRGAVELVVLADGVVRERIPVLAADGTPLMADPLASEAELRRLARPETKEQA